MQISTSHAEAHPVNQHINQHAAQRWTHGLRQHGELEQGGKGEQARIAGEGIQARSAQGRDSSTRVKRGLNTLAQRQTSLT